MTTEHLFKPYVGASNKYANLTEDEIIRRIAALQPLSVLSVMNVMTATDANSSFRQRYLSTDDSINEVASERNRPALRHIARATQAQRLEWRAYLDDNTIGDLDRVVQGLHSVARYIFALTDELIARGLLPDMANALEPITAGAQMIWAGHMPLLPDNAEPSRRLYFALDQVEGEYADYLADAVLRTKGRV